MTEEHLDLLKNSVILRALPYEQLVELSSHIQLKHFPEGDVIIKVGDPGDGAYIVSNGAVAVTVERGAGAGQAVLGLLGVGQVFGELALLDQQPRSATVTATTETVCLFLPADIFSQLLHLNPSVAAAILPILCQRLREADRWIQALM